MKQNNISAGFKLITVIIALFSFTTINAQDKTQASSTESVLKKSIEQLNSKKYYESIKSMDAARKEVLSSFAEEVAGVMPKALGKLKIMKSGDADVINGVSYNIGFPTVRSQSEVNVKKAYIDGELALKDKIESTEAKIRPVIVFSISNELSYGDMVQRAHSTDTTMNKMPGGEMKAIKVKGYPALLNSFEESSMGNLTIVLENCIIMLEAANFSRPSDLIEIAEAIDLKAIKAKFN